MAIFRQFVVPFLIVLVFLVALVAVSARIFLPEDMAAPAPIDPVGQFERAPAKTVAGLPPALKTLIEGLPEDAGLAPW